MTRQQWISARADVHYARHPNWSVAFIRAYADAAREWPLYREPEYGDADAQLESEDMDREYYDEGWRQDRNGHWR